MRYITLLGMSRSGNHALVRWITSHWEEAGFQVYFENNVTKAFLNHVKFIMPHARKDTRKVYFVSLEDDNARTDEALSVLTAVADRNILLLRDPLNLFASRLEGLGPPRGLNLGPEASEEEVARRVPEVLSAMPHYMGLWFNHHREFSGETNRVRNKTCILYNRWLVDRDYRRAIVEGDLGLKFTDSGHMARAGSSFGEKMWSDADYLGRWRDYWDRPVYRPVRENAELVRISREMGVEGV